MHVSASTQCQNLNKALFSTLSSTNKNYIELKPYCQANIESYEISVGEKKTTRFRHIAQLTRALLESNDINEIDKELLLIQFQIFKIKREINIVQKPWYQRILHLFLQAVFNANECVKVIETKHKPILDLEFTQLQNSLRTFSFFLSLPNSNIKQNKEHYVAILKIIYEALVNEQNFSINTLQKELKNNYKQDSLLIINMKRYWEDKHDAKSLQMLIEAFESNSLPLISKSSSPWFSENLSFSITQLLTTLHQLPENEKFDFIENIKIIFTNTPYYRNIPLMRVTQIGEVPTPHEIVTYINCLAKLKDFTNKKGWYLLPRLHKILYDLPIGERIAFVDTCLQFSDLYKNKSFKESGYLSDNTPLNVYALVPSQWRKSFFEHVLSFYTKTQSEDGSYDYTISPKNQNKVKSALECLKEVQEEIKFLIEDPTFFEDDANYSPFMKILDLTYLTHIDKGTRNGIARQTRFLLEKIDPNANRVLIFNKLIANKLIGVPFKFRPKKYNAFSLEIANIVEKLDTKKVAPVLKLAFQLIAESSPHNAEDKIEEVLTTIMILDSIHDLEKQEIVDLTLLLTANLAYSIKEKNILLKNIWLLLGPGERRAPINLVLNLVKDNKIPVANLVRLITCGRFNPSFLEESYKIFLLIPSKLRYYFLQKLIEVINEYKDKLLHNLVPPLITNVFSDRILAYDTIEYVKKNLESPDVSSEHKESIYNSIEKLNNHLPARLRYLLIKEALTTDQSKWEHQFLLDVK